MTRYPDDVRAREYIREALARAEAAKAVVPELVTLLRAKDKESK